MSSRRLGRSLRAYRMGDPAGVHPAYSGDGSRLYPGRWNEKGQPVIYASEHYSATARRLPAPPARGPGRR